MSIEKTVLESGSLETTGLETAGSEAGWLAGSLDMDRLVDCSCNLTRSTLGEVGGFEP
mgnify:CR=1 FL=1